MAAADHLHPQQLSMFMRAGDVVAQFGPSSWDRNPGESNARIMRRKGAEARREGIAADVAARGVQSPVDLAHEGTGRARRPMIAEGHHRIVSQVMADPDRLVPVRHHRTVDEAGLYHLDYS